MRIAHYFLFGLMVIVLAACQPSSGPVEIEPTAITPSIELSPVRSPIATPAMGITPQISPPISASGERFQIARPVRAGATMVSGTGTKGVAIKLYDLTHMGVELGEGVVQSDGRFAIKVEPLSANIRIGIQLVEQDDGIWQDKARLGPEALVVPLVGVFVDTVLVSP